MRIDYMKRLGRYVATQGEVIGLSTIDIGQIVTERIMSKINNEIENKWIRSLVYQEIQIRKACSEARAEAIHNCMMAMAALNK